MHKLLQRQLARALGGQDGPPGAAQWAAFLQKVDEAYRQADADRLQLERSLELTSQELIERNARLRRDNEDLRRADQALRRSEERFQLAAVATHDAIYDWDVAAGAITWNENMALAYGHRKHGEARDGRWRTDHIHPEDAAAVEESLERALAGEGATWQGEYRFRRGDGTYAFVVDRGCIVRDAQGKPTRVIGTMVDLTDRKDAEDAAREAQSVMAAALEATADGILVLDLEGGIVQFNQQFLRMWRIAPGLSDADDPEERIAAVMEQLEEPESFRAAAREMTQHPERETEDVLRFKDGRVFERTSKPQRISGQVVGSVLSFRDVSARARAEEELRRSEERFSKAFLASPVPCAITRVRDGLFLDANDAFLRMHGYARDEVVGHTTHELDLWDNRRLRGPHIEALRAKGEVRDLDIRYRTKTGEQREAVTSVNLLELSGEACLLAIAIDVTERKRAEEALRESEQRFRELAEHVRDIFWVATPDFERFLYLSPGFAAITGQDMASPQVRGLAWLAELIHADDRERLGAAVRRVMAGEPSEVEFRLRRPDGGMRWLHQRASPVRDASGAVVRLVGAATDITERKRAEEVAVREERLAMLGTLAAGVAHEINNPLGFLKATEQLNRDLLRALRASPDLPSHAACAVAEVEESITTSLLGVQRIADIVASLRLLAKPSAERQPVELNRVAESAVLLSGSRGGGRVRVDLGLGQDLPTVSANQTELGQVLLNLVLNAVDAAPQEGGVVTVRTYRENGHILAEVADNGPGIPAEVQRRLFQPFFTTKDRGTGLGLAISRRIAESHNGTLTYRTAPGAGTTFTLRLPVAPDERPSGRPPQTPARNLQHPPGHTTP